MFSVTLVHVNNTRRLNKNFFKGEIMKAEVMFAKNYNVQLFRKLLSLFLIKEMKLYIYELFIKICVSRDQWVWG